VMEEKIRNGIVCDVDIGPAIVVIVPENDTESVAIRPVDAGFFRNVLERAIAIVAIEDVWLGVIDVGMAVGPDVLHGAAIFVVLDGEVDVVRHVKVDITIVIDIGERATGTPLSVAANRSLSSHVRKSAVSVIVVELVGSDAGYVQVGPAVVVDIGGACA